LSLFAECTDHTDCLGFCKPGKSLDCLPNIPLACDPELNQCTTAYAIEIYMKKY